MCSRFGKVKEAPVPPSLHVEKKAQSAPILKTLVIGDMHVGKSSLALRFAKGEFSDTPIVTHTMDFVCPLACLLLLVPPLFCSS